MTLDTRFVTMCHTRYDSGRTPGKRSRYGRRPCADPVVASSQPPAAHADARYRRKVLRLLGTATFFNGYDAFVLPFVLSLILVGIGGTQAAAGTVQLVAQSGAVVAFFLAAQADRIGRRRLLLITISGYTVAVVATALSPKLAFLTGAQFVAQVFLGAEWAVAVTMVVEEFPTHERSRGLTVLAAMLTLGAILAGVLGFLGLGSTAIGWRAFYLVGVVPLIVGAVARRGMRETGR
jgi:MFS transporter, putative metabolite:H+ symporter